jgi:site-specific DNA recombinase
MKIGIYCRVSSDEQVQNGLSLLDQEIRGIEYCNQNGYDYELFREPGVSGTTLIVDRPSGYSLIQKTEKIKDKITGVFTSEIDGVYCTDWDRISRNEMDKIFIINHFISNDIKYIELGDTKDLNDPNQQLLMSIKSILSSYEIKKLKIRIKRGIERSVSEGNVGGGSMVNYGYKKGENKKLIIDENESKVIRMIFELSLQGLGTKKISEILNDKGIPTKRMVLGNRPMKVRGESKNHFLWRDSVVYGILKNPMYKGERVFRDKIYPCPKIVSEEEYELVQRGFKQRTNTKNTTNKYFYLLKGLIYCDRCRSRFYGRTREDLSDNQYICSSQRYKNKFCGNRGINIPKLNNIVWNSFLSLPKDLKKLYSPENNLRVRKLNDKIRLQKSLFIRNQKEIDRLISLFKPNEDGFRYIKTEIESLVKRNNKIEEKLSLLNKEKLLLSNENELIERVENQINQIKKKPEISDEEKQMILRNNVNHIDVLWDNDIRNHIITIDFIYDKNTDVFYEKVVKIKYVKSGWRFDESDLSYEFHKKVPKIENYRDPLTKKVVSSSIEVNLKTNNSKNKFSRTKKIQTKG